MNLQLLGHLPFIAGWQMRALFDFTGLDTDASPILAIMLACDNTEVTTSLLQQTLGIEVTPTNILWRHVLCHRGLEQMLFTPSVSTCCSPLAKSDNHKQHMCYTYWPRTAFDSRCFTYASWSLDSPHMHRSVRIAQNRPLQTTSTWTSTSTSTSSDICSNLSQGLKHQGKV